MYVINWLNQNQGFVMSLLTLIYVVATIVKPTLLIFTLTLKPWLAHRFLAPQKGWKKR
jgi:hypothetical protein